MNWKESSMTGKNGEQWKERERVVIKERHFSQSPIGSGPKHIIFKPVRQIFPVELTKLTCGSLRAPPHRRDLLSSPLHSPHKLNVQTQILLNGDSSPLHFTFFSPSFGLSVIA